MNSPPNAQANLVTVTRVKVPLGQSWAAVFFELQGRNQAVSVTNRHKIYVASENSQDDASPSRSIACRSLRGFKATSWPMRLAASAGCLVFLSLAVLGASGSKSKILHVASGASRQTAPSARPKASPCLTDKTQAAKRAIEKDVWSKLGGVGYSTVTLNCQNKSAQYRVVKNLLTGEIESVKTIG